MKVNRIFLFCVIVLFCSIPAPGYSTNEKMFIGEIAIEGNHKIETDTIRSYISSKVGDVFSPLQIRQDLQSIYNSGFFRDIQVDAQPFEGKLKITFILKEKPSIREIILEGYDELDEDKIRKVIDVKINTILDELALDKNLDNIKKRYAEDGFYLAEAEYELEEVSPHSVNVIFKINEGPEVEVQEIRFEGNEDFSDDDLKDIIETSEHWFFSWLTGSGYLQPEILEQDMARLLAFYFDKGYIQAKVEDPEITLSEDKTELTIVIPVEEGVQFTISKIDFVGNHIIENAQIEEKLETESGEIFNRTKIRQDVTSISNLYAEQGYLLTEVYPSTKENIEDKTVEITFNVNEGKITYAGRILISGNDNTRDKVIRRQMQFVEGDVLTSSKLRRSYERVNNLGFFEKVDLQTKETSQNNVLDIDLKTKERLTGSITMGAGWSSVNKIVGNVSVSQGNLFGRGQRVTLAASIGRVMENYNLSFTEPWLFDIPLSAGFDLYLRTRRRLSFSNYQSDTRGGALPLSYAITDYTRLYFTYRYEEVNIHNVPDNASIFFKRREGKNTTSSTYYAIVRDSRDNWIRPTTGSRNKLSYELAGSVLGGDNYYHRTYFDSSWHFPLFWKFVLSTHGKIGYQTSYAGRELPVQELFVVGGAQTVRGFQYGALGPKQDGEVIGGNKMLLFNAELHFPLFDPLAGLLFFDMGNAFAEGQNYQLNNLRTAAGIGIRFYTPMGPIRLDWGYKLDREDRESAYEWHFAMGTYF